MYYGKSHINFNQIRIKTTIRERKEADLKIEPYGREKPRNFLQVNVNTNGRNE